MVFHPAEMKFGWAFYKISKQKKLVENEKKKKKNRADGQIETKTQSG